MKLSVLLLLFLPALSAATLQDSSQDKNVSILELAPRDRTPSITSNTTMVTHRFRLSSRMSRQKRQTHGSTLFDGSQNLKWVAMSGSLPDGAIWIHNKNHANRFDYVCKHGCDAGFYSPSQGRYCHYPYDKKRKSASQFEILVNKDNFELLEWKDGSHGSVPKHSVKTCSHGNIYVGKTKNGLGKVHIHHKGFFLPWEVSQNYKFYQVLTFSKDVISEEISDIKYNTATSVFKYPPDSMFTTTVVNNECSPVVKTPTVTTRSQRESRWDISSSIRIGVSTSFTAGIPIIASGTVEVSSDLTFTFSGGETKIEETSHSIPVQVTVPANHSCKVRIVMQKYKAAIPFTARVTRRYRNGKTSSTYISGTYHGVDNRDVTALVERCQPVPDAEACPDRSSYGALFPELF